jgi:hypothetical protein
MPGRVNLHGSALSSLAGKSGNASVRLETLTRHQATHPVVRHRYRAGLARNSYGAASYAESYRSSGRSERAISAKFAYWGRIRGGIKARRCRDTVNSPIRRPNKGLSSLSCKHSPNRLCEPMGGGFPWRSVAPSATIFASCSGAPSQPLVNQRRPKSARVGEFRRVRLACDPKNDLSIRTPKPRSRTRERRPRGQIAANRLGKPKNDETPGALDMLLRRHLPRKGGVGCSGTTIGAWREFRHSETVRVRADPQEHVPTGAAAWHPRGSMPGSHCGSTPSAK